MSACLSRLFGLRNQQGSFIENRVENTACCAMLLRESHGF